MNKYAYKFTIQASTEKEAKEKIQVLAKLASAIPHSLLCGLADRGPELLNGPNGAMIQTYLIGDHAG